MTRSVVVTYIRTKFSSHFVRSQVMRIRGKLSKTAPRQSQPVLGGRWVLDYQIVFVAHVHITKFDLAEVE